MDAPPLCPSQDIVNGNDKSEPIPHLGDSVRIIMDCRVLPKKMRLSNLRIH